MSRGSRLLATLGLLALIAAVAFLWLRERDDVELAAAHAEPAEALRSNATASLTLPALEPDALASEERVQTSRDEVDQALWRFRGVVWNEQREPLELFGVVATRLGRSREVLEQIELPLEPRAGGRFEFANLTPGHWEVAPFAPDRVLVHKRIFKERDGDLWPYLLNAIEKPPSLVTGLVELPSGELAAHARIRFERADGSSELDPRLARGNARPTDRGRFSLELEEGDWWLVASAPGWRDSVPVKVTSSAGLTVPDLRLPLREPRRIRFHVVPEAPARPRSFRLSWTTVGSGEWTGREGLEGLDLEVPISGENTIDWTITCLPDEPWAGRVELGPEERSRLVRLERLPAKPVSLVLTRTRDSFSGGETAVACDASMGLLPEVQPRHDPARRQDVYDLPRPGRWLIRSRGDGSGEVIDVPDVPVHDLSLEFVIINDD